MIVKLTNPVTMVLWEKRELPKSVKNEKGVWEKTGGIEEFTVYTFRDEFGDVLKFMTKDNDLRHFENSELELFLNVSYDDYNNKNVVKIDHVEQLAS